MAMEKDVAKGLMAEFQRNETGFDVTRIAYFMEEVSRLLMMDYYETPSEDKILEGIARIRELFSAIVGCPCHKEDIEGFIEELPQIRNLLNGSIDSIYEGDPASASKEQIVFTYPGFNAILYHRVAHFFHLKGQPLLARGISEIAHSKWGIDIAPGATIGKRFFIDHGTGIVIGETAILGDNVKLYQGATIGAMSLGAGRKLSGNKRHPTVEDDVTIYSNASILGGETVIGKGSVIGANVYLKESVPPLSVVVLEDSGIKIYTKNK